MQVISRILIDDPLATRAAGEAAVSKGPNPSEHWMNRRHGALPDGKLQTRRLERKVNCCSGATRAVLRLLSSCQRAHPARRMTS
jgi:hypothetical protein